MKKILLLAVATSLAGSAFADQLSAPVVHRSVLPPVNIPAQTEGSLQRGVRLGNPAQMFNPVAPKVYGDGREFVAPRDQDQGLRPRDRSRSFPIGLRLLSFSF